MHKEVTSSTGETHHTLILSSWQRCRQFGLEHHSEPELQRLGSHEQQQRQHQYRELLNTTDHEVLPFYENILANSQCSVLLTDPRGRVLKRWGDGRFIGRERRAFFNEGVSWREQHAGTNAIGTVLACGQPVQVLRDEHFLKANRFMIGSAAPLFDSQRALIGVLDISSDAYLQHAHALGLVRLMAQSVENRLIFNAFQPEHFILIFNSNIDTLDSQWAGVLVFNEQGRIIAANRRAELLLGLELEMVDIAQLFDCRLAELMQQPELQPMPLLTRSQHRMYGLVKRPPPGVAPVNPHQSTDKTAGERIDLNTISLGDADMDLCIQQAERIIEKDIPILIHGETGTGKEVFVKALHQASSRCDQPLVAVNCAAIPAELVESELFGYEKGAFTGASQKGAIGLIRKAHRGILFLDEIGDMPLKAQARLLRVLQERLVTPLGSTQAYPVDIKIISATNRSLRTEVQQHRFRQDLYYRVSGLNIELPPLRHRSDKRALIRRIHSLHGGPAPQAPLPECILGLFEQHPWPGNIRQLSSVLQIALAMADGDVIQERHLPADFFADLGIKPTSTNPTHRLDCAPPVVCDTDAHVDIQALTVTVYHQRQGNISQAARQLGISRNTLYKRLKQAGLR